MFSNPSSVCNASIYCVTFKSISCHSMKLVNNQRILCHCLGVCVCLYLCICIVNSQIVKLNGFERSNKKINRKKKLRIWSIFYVREKGVHDYNLIQSSCLLTQKFVFFIHTAKHLDVPKATTNELCCSAYSVIVVA